MSNFTIFSAEWKKTSMDHIGTIYGGLSGKSKIDFGGGNARYVTFLGVLENVILDVRHTERVYVGRGESQNPVLKGDLLFNASSETPGDLAIGAVMGEQLDNLYLNSFCFGFRIHDKDRYVPLFLAYFFRGPVGRDIMNALAQGATRYNMSKSQFSALELSIPCGDEQRAIAEALSDVDGLLNALEALIAKKQAIKQAVMQQLLTGKTRLPGFSGAWQEMRVGDLFDATAGGDLVQSRYSDVRDNRYPYPIYANGLEQQGLYGFSNYSEEPAGAITVTARGTLGKAFHRKTPFVAIGRLLVLKPKVSLDARFFCEYINFGIRFAIESTGVPQLTAPQVSRYLLPVPSESEQCAIASVLSDIDAEITALEQRRDKTRAIKQGMMQQLLTGWVRLSESRIGTDDTDYAD